jgi:hypothetical protein
MDLNQGFQGCNCKNWEVSRSIEGACAKIKKIRTKLKFIKLPIKNPKFKGYNRRHVILF